MDTSLIIKGTKVIGIKDKSKSHIVVPEGITEICDEAFADDYLLNSIVLPNTLIRIGNRSFLCCSSLTELVSGSQLSEIGSSAFEKCQQLHLVDLSQSQVTALPEFCFRECRKLDVLLLSPTMKEIEEQAFTNCMSLKEVVFPEGTLCIKDSLQGCSLNRMVIPNSLLHIEPISARRVKEIKISDSQFERFELVLPKKEEISYDLIPEIRCPVCGAFYSECQCENKCNNIIVEGTTLVKAKTYNMKKFVVPERITQIGYRAFYWNEDIETVVLPAGLVEIGEEAFALCCNLKDVNIHELTDLKQIDDCAFEYCERLSLHYTSFFRLEKLQRVGRFAFFHTSIQSVVIRQPCEIGGDAFASCSDLKEVSLTSAGSKFEWEVFSDCARLTEVSLPDDITYIPEKMFADCASLEEVFIPSKVSKIADAAFYGCKKLKQVCCLGEIKTIGNDAFYGCSSLEEEFEFELLTMTYLESIGDKAFWGCEALKHIEFPRRLNSIGNEAFAYCEGIRYFYIPKSVNVIGEKAFPEFSYNGIHFDIEANYKPRGWDVTIVEDGYGETTITWGFVSPYNVEP